MSDLYFLCIPSIINHQLILEKIQKKQLGKLCQIIYENNQIFDQMMVIYKSKIRFILVYYLYFEQSIKPFETSMSMYKQQYYSPYIHNQKRIENSQQLPIQYSDRRITDVCCCCVGVIFGLILFILACIFFNSNHLLRANYPTDSQGHVCIMDQASNGEKYPFLYFSDLNNPFQHRHCVKDCPQSGMPSSCFNQQQCNVGFYPNYPSIDRLGAYCFPTDDEARNKLQEQTNLKKDRDTIQNISLLLIGLGIATGVSLIWMILVQFLPKIMVWVAFILAIILLIITAIVFLIDNSTKLHHVNGWAIFIAIVCLILALVLIFYVVVHRRRIKICGAFLKHATTMLKENCKTFLYIPLFMLLTFLFGVLTVFEYLAFSSLSEPTSSSDSIYNKLSRSWILTTLWVIQTLWGLSFLRDSFNMCVSGNAIDWYFRIVPNCCRSFKSWICKHVGSVAGGSFLSAFLYIPCLIIDLCCNSMDCCCLDFPRSDVYAYIYMTGASYCPSVRQSQYLCERSKICRGNQSANFMYSLSARLIPTLITLLIIYWISWTTLNYQTINQYLLLGIFFIGLYIVCYFVDIHVDVAQALMIAFLAEYEVQQNGYQEMDLCRDELKTMIDDLQRKGDHGYLQK